MSDEELRRILVEAVPEDPAPADRMGQIASRVRRRRLVVGSASAAAAVAAAVAIAVPMMLAAPGADPGPGPGDGSETVIGSVRTNDEGCPERLPDRVRFVDKPGPLVPAGAAEAVLCETPTDLTAMLDAPRLLTHDVESFVAALNALPDREQFWNRLRAREAAKGNVLPPEVKETLGQTCTLIGYPTVPSFILRYPDRDPVLVQYDQNCGTVAANGRTRFAESNPVDAFMRLYQAQLGSPSPTPRR